MGLGVQGGGVGVARYFARHGAQVLVTDLKSDTELAGSIKELGEFPYITYHLGGHHEKDIIEADCIVKGPSIPWDNMFVEEALKRNIPVIMETAYFAQNTKATLVGITGTRGKSTTTTCIYAALKKFYTKGEVFLSGNVPGNCAIELLDIAKENDIVVLELSSWQLSGFHRIQVSPSVAVFTNIYEDHLNYYDNMVEYVYDKTAIFAYQKPKDTLITTAKTLAILKTHRATLPSHLIECSADDFEGKLLHIRGEHNKLNAALALVTVEQMLPGVDRKSIAACIGDMKTMHFRQEVIGVHKNVTVVNDSTSTTPISAITALDTFQDRKIVLILGGNSKKLSMHDLTASIEKYQKNICRIVLLKGSMTDEIAPELMKMSDITCTEIFDDFTLAVRRSMEEASKITEPVYLLFSPGATSFAQFRNEFDRGEKFNAIVSDIMSK